MPIDDGGPAFPAPYDQHHTYRGESLGDGGMSLRDWFAGQAIAGMHAALCDASDWPEQSEMLTMAQIAYMQADAMLKTRKELTHG